MSVPADTGTVFINLFMREVINSVTQARRALAWVDGLYAGSSGDIERVPMERQTAEEVVDIFDAACHRWPEPDSVASVTISRELADELVFELADFLCWCRGYRAADPRLPDMTGVRWMRERLIAATDDATIRSRPPF